MTDWGNGLARLQDIIAHRDPGVLARVAADNALPLLGVLLAGWSAYELVVFYWIETAVVALFAILSVAVARPEDQPAGPSTTLAGPSIAMFLVFHAGMFLAVHMIFINTLLSEAGMSAFNPLPDVDLSLSAFGLPILFLVVLRGIGFVSERVQNEPTSPIVIGLYVRIIAMQFVIILGGWLAFAIGGIAVLVLLTFARFGMELFWPEISRYLASTIKQSAPPKP
ncbi:DUF6498-containing protein [Pelagibacterium montanilacus]|uniref:DUF6498-containing protein n=1 Tax=Pelagibacterium montanilacus TaxID=2185280 RepID=UPI000F8D6E01|nr:DUF6498-containing protein [Pelagibacterium montanilacus]